MPTVVGAIGVILCCMYLTVIYVQFNELYITNGGPGSSVAVPTELRAGRSGDRIPVGRDFPYVQTGPGAHPASCTMGTGSFPGVKYGRGVLVTTHPLLVPWSWKSSAIPFPTLWATRPVTGTLFLYLFTLRMLRLYPFSIVRVMRCVTEAAGACRVSFVDK
jgi:hypothetical protein